MQTNDNNNFEQTNFMKVRVNKLYKHRQILNVILLSLLRIAINLLY